jgi:hypothetical protein
MIKLKSLDSKMDEIFNRLKDNKMYDLDLKPYSLDLLNKTLKFYEEKEDYEKCLIILDKSSKRFNHEQKYKKY